MNLLVVEDDDEKLDELTAFLQTMYSLGKIDTAKSLQSGLRAALSDSHELILLDMTMRNFDRTMSDDGGRPHPFAGREILRQMRRSGIATPVIVVTHFDGFGEGANYTPLEELREELSEKYPNYFGTIQFRSNVDEWKAALANMIDACMGTR